MKKEIRYVKTTGFTSPLINWLEPYDKNQCDTLVVIWQDYKGMTGIIKIKYKKDGEDNSAN